MFFPEYFPSPAACGKGYGRAHETYFNYQVALQIPCGSGNGFFCLSSVNLQKHCIDNLDIHYSSRRDIFIIYYLSLISNG